MATLAPDGWVFAWTRVNGRLTGKYYPPDQVPPDAERPAEDGPIKDGVAFALGAIIGAGDTTTSVYGDDGKPYRFKEGNKSGQRSELKHRLEERFVKNNKAPWPVNVTITSD